MFVSDWTRSRVSIYKENKLIFLCPSTSYENAMNGKVTSDHSSFHLYQSYYKWTNVHVSTKVYVPIIINKHFGVRYYFDDDQLGRILYTGRMT